MAVARQHANNGMLVAQMGEHTMTKRIDTTRQPQRKLATIQRRAARQVKQTLARVSA